MNLIFYMVRTETPGAHKGSGYNEKKTTSGSCRRWFLHRTDLDAAAGGEGLAFEEQELFGEEAGEAAQDGGGGDHLRGVADGKLHGDLPVKHGGGRQADLVDEILRAQLVPPHIGVIGAPDFVLRKIAGQQRLQLGQAERLLERADHDQIGDMHAVVALLRGSGRSRVRT